MPSCSYFRLACSKRSLVILSEMFVIPSVLSRRNKNLKRRMDRCHSSMLQLFYLESKGKYILPRGMGAGSRLTQKTGREEEPPAQFRLLFLYVFCFFPSLLPLGLPCVNWASQEGCLFNLKSSLGSSDLPLFHFHRLFPSLFSHCHFGPIFPILTNNSAKK